MTDYFKLGRVRLLAGTIHPELAQRVSEHLNLKLTDTTVKTFANRETRVEINECCRGCDAFIIQPLCNSEDGKLSVNDALMELLLTVSALRGASAKRVTAVVPIYGYARQDKKDHTRAAVSARLVADLLETAGIDRAITVDLHASQIQGFFRKPLEDIEGVWLLVGHIRSRFNADFKVRSRNNVQPSNLALKSVSLETENRRNALPYLGRARDNIVIVSPDAGGAKRAAQVAEYLGVDCAITSKERLEANKVKSMRIIGNVRGKIAILIDDMADTCGTLCMAARDLINKHEAKEVHAYVVHGLFSGPALDRLNACDELSSVTCTNTLPQNTNVQRCNKIQVLDVSKLLAETIHFVCTEQSLKQNLNSNL